MIDMSAEIKSNTSMGNIELGKFINTYLPEIKILLDVEIKEYLIPFPLNKKMYGYIIDNGRLVISTTNEGEIVSIGCNERYKGVYDGNIHPGIKMGKLISLTKKQRIVNGAIIINDDYGISFTLPSPYDEIADDISMIPLDLELNEIYVSNFSFWK